MRRLAPPGKELTLFLLQRLLGLDRYLRLFGRYRIRTLRFDPRERDFFTFLDGLPDHGLVLDIGANLGVMTFYLSRRLPRGEVIAFEPMPENLAVLRRFVESYRLTNVRVEACALGDREGDASMVMPVEFGAARHGLSHVVHETIGSRNEGVRVRVPMRRLDDFAFPDASAPVTGIKLDVENFERFVLAGARETLRRHRPLLYVELWPNDNRTRCFEFLIELGYEVLVSERQRLVKFEPGRHTAQNFIFRYRA